MSLVSPHDIHRIQALQPGQFALPSLDWHAHQALEDSPRLRKSIACIRTILINHGFRSVADHLDVDDNKPWPTRMEELQCRIITRMRDYLAHPSMTVLMEVFHLVQLWGGASGRNIYVRGGGFEQNYNSQAYKQFALAASSRGETVERRIEIMNRAADQISNWGPSFATKHSRFWAEAAGATAMPIYDRNIARGCLGYRWVRWSDYREYVQHLAAVAGKGDVVINQLERLAFNFFSSPEGQEWLEFRTGRA